MTSTASYIKTSRLLIQLNVNIFFQPRLLKNLMTINIETLCDCPIYCSYRLMPTHLCAIATPNANNAKAVKSVLCTQQYKPRLLDGWR